MFPGGHRAGGGRVSFNLGNVLVEQGRTDEAVEAFTAAVSDGYVEAWVNLGVLHDEAGRGALAREAFRAAADAGDPGGEMNLGVMALDIGDRATAETHLRAAVAGGHAEARVELALLLLDAGQRGGGRGPAARRGGRRRGGVAAPAGRPARGPAWTSPGAERLYLRAVDAGDLYARTNLGVLYAEHDRVDEAIAQWEQAAAAGDDLAAENLREVRRPSAPPSARLLAGRHGSWPGRSAATRQ